MPKLIDETGNCYGRLTVLKQASRKRKSAMWLCSCTCGNQHTVAGESLRMGRTRSCGCLRSEYASQGIRERSITHGLTQTPEFKAWESMRARCENPNVVSFPYYGGRGIKICAQWQTSFKQFYTDMGPRLTTKHSLDRIDNDGDYTPENCRWATAKTQARNRSNNHPITHKGKTQLLVEWAEELGIRPETLSGRLHRGWPIERALSTPVNPD